jgi:penicillin-binding protein 2
MACVAMTIANKGVRYQPYLVDSVWDYDMENCIYKTEKTVAQTITTKVDNTWDIVTQGMILASSNNIPAEYSLTNLGYDVAIKTGTPQLDARTQDSLFIGFAPADDPKIAFCGVLEGGEYSKYMIRSILRLYESIYGKFDGSVDDPETTSATETDENGSIVTTITSSTSSTANNVENPLADEPVANDMAQDPVADDDDNEGNPDA